MNESGLGFAKHYIWGQDSQNLGCVPRARKGLGGNARGFPDSFFGRALGKKKQKW